MEEERLRNETICVRTHHDAQRRALWCIKSERGPPEEMHGALITPRFARYRARLRPAIICCRAPRENVTMPYHYTYIIFVILPPSFQPLFEAKRRYAATFAHYLSISICRASSCVRYSDMLTKTCLPVRVNSTKNIFCTPPSQTPTAIYRAVCSFATAVFMSSIFLVLFDVQDAICEAFI